MTWTEIENSHLLRGTCNSPGCVSDTLAAPGQTDTAMCGPHRMIDAEIKTRGGHVQQFSAPSGVVPEAFRKKSWIRGDDGVIRDRWGRYVLPDPVTGVLREYTRVSTLKDVFSNSWNIRMWDRRTAVYGVATNPDLAAQAAQAVPDAEGRFAFDNPWREHLDRVAKLAFVAGGGESGANNGTDWHRWRELFDATSDWSNLDVPEEVTKTLVARQAEMERHGLTVPAGMSERVVIIPELDAAGTFDELFEAADGTLFIGDEKSQRAFYDGGLLEAIQLAAYSRAKWIVDVKAVGNDPAANLAALTPMPAVDQTTAKIIWVPIGKGYAELKNVDLTEAWGWAQLAVRLREARKTDWVTTAPAPERLADPRGVPMFAGELPDGVYPVAEEAAERAEAAGMPASTVEPDCRSEFCAKAGRCPERRGTIHEQAVAVKGGPQLDALHLKAHHEAAGRWAPYFDRVAGLEPADESAAASPNTDGCTCTVETHPVSGAVVRIIDLESECPNTNAMHEAERARRRESTLVQMIKNDICTCMPDEAVYCASSNCRGGAALCSNAGHEWNCPFMHAPGVLTVRDEIERKLRELTTTEQMTALWNEHAPAGRWDDGLTELGMKVLGRG